METIEIASNLRSVISSLYKGLRKNMSSVAGCSMTEIETIGHLARNKQLLPTELAALVNITPPSMSQILSQMEKVKIIKKTPAKEDKRKVYISLAPAGQKLLEQTRYERDEWLKSTIEESLTTKEKELLVKALPVLNKLINK